MRKLIFLFVFVPSFLCAQQAVRTENASTKYKNYSAATTGDTLFTSATAVSGSSIPWTSTIGFVTRLTIGTPVASDTIILKNGTGTVLQLIQPASAPFVYNVELGIRLDTSLVYIQKKTSNATLQYRAGY